MTRPPTTAPIVNTVAIPKESTITFSFLNKVCLPAPASQTSVHHSDTTVSATRLCQSISQLSVPRISRISFLPFQHTIATASSSKSIQSINVDSYCHGDPSLRNLFPTSTFPNPTTYPLSTGFGAFGPPHLPGKVDRSPFLFEVSPAISAQKARNHIFIAAFSHFRPFRGPCYVVFPYPCCKLAVISRIPRLRVSFTVVGYGSVTGSGQI